MEPIYIFYKEIPVEENNIFTANVTEKNEVEKVKFRKSAEYAITELLINQDIDSSLDAVTDTDRQNVLSNLIQKLVKEIKEYKLDLKIYNTEKYEVIIPFQKKPASDIAPIKLTFYNTTTKKQENLQFYDYIQHLEKYGLVWEYSALEFKYSIEFSKDKNKLIRKMTMGKNTRKKLFVDESRIWNMKQPPDNSIGSMIGKKPRSILLG